MAGIVDNSTNQSKMASKSFSSRLQMETTVNLEWRNIDYRMMVKSPKSTLLNKVYDHKQILSNINGIAKSGEMIAIMGPTGCGKTSLLNVLAARAPMGSKAFLKLSGQVLVNDHLRDDSSFRSLSAYVLQDDKLFPHLTIYETLMLAAQFYLPSTLNQDEKEQLVHDIIAELGLVKAKNTIIGDEKIRGVSGGERRRASIAVQLISNPSVLFLDEPTSGLDSFQAQSVMEAMKSMAENNRLVVSVIHQPRSSIYNMFDRLLLLSEGKQMYFGKASDAVKYFSGAGFVCPEHFNPSDFFLDILSPDNRTPELEDAAANRIQQFAVLYQSKNAKESIADSKDIPLSVQTVVVAAKPFDPERIIRNIKLLSWRSLTGQLRDVTTITARFATSCFFGLIIGGIYSDTKHDQQGIQNITGLLFIVTLNQAFNNMLSALNTFPREKVIVYRERAAHAYDTASYYLSKFLVELPINVLPAMLFGCIIYWLANLNPTAFGGFLGILLLHSLTSLSLGLFVSALAPSVEVANVSGPPLVIIMLLFSGFYINIGSLPVVANLIPYIAYLRWTFEAFCVNEFIGETFTCKSTGACQATGDVVLEHLSFGGQSSPNYAVFALSMCFIAYFTLAYVTLEFSRETYMPLGFEGSKFKQYFAAPAPAAKEVDGKKYDDLTNLENQPKSADSTV